MLLAGAQTDEETISSEILLSRQLNVRRSIIQLFLLADYRLSSLYAIMRKCSQLSNEMPCTFETLEQRQTEVFSLKRLVRGVIRNRLFHSKHIEELPLPKLIKTYLYIPELDKFGNQELMY